MEKSGIVKKAEYQKSWENKYGRMYDHAIEIGEDRGIYSSKSPDQKKFVVGETVAYEVIPNGDFPPKIKPVQAQENNNSGGGGKYQGKNGHGNVASFALSYAKDVYNASQQAISATAMTEDQMFRLADRMHDWLKSKEA